MGSESAIRELAKEPDCPEAITYLVEWSFDLYGRSGVGLEGVAPLSNTELVHWSFLRGVRLEPYEVEALMTFDRILRNPEKERNTGESELVERELTQQPQWPKRRVEPVLRSDS